MKSPAKIRLPSSTAPRSPRRKMAAHTIHDIAALASVSSITVSRYFNAPDKVSPAVRERLRGIVQETGYVPSPMAGGLASARSKTVGAVMQNIASATFADLVHGMNDGLQGSGLQLLLASTQYSKELEERAIKAFAGWHPSALILTRDDHSPAADAMLRHLRMPVVEAWGLVEGRPFHQVGFPHAEVGVELARHFMAQGVQRIRFVLGAAAEDFRAQQRAAGYAQAMRDAGLVPDIRVADIDDEFEAGAQALAALSQQPARSRPRAIIFATDPMAAGAILAASACGLRIPADCAVAGFGDAPLSARLSPALTTMRPARYQIGKLAAQTVLRLLAHPPADDEPVQCLRVPCELIVRDSSVKRRR